MKPKFFFLILISITVFHIQSSAGEDEFIANIYAPTANSQASPHCIVYNDINNMIYTYTGQKVIVINKATSEIEHAILVGQTGYYTWHYASIKLSHKLAFDHSRNYIYCANEDNELIVINCVNNEVISSISSVDPLLESFIFYNSELDILYWIQNNATGGPNRLFAYDPSDLSSPLGSYETSGKYLDIAFSIENQYLITSNRTSIFSGNLILLNPTNLNVYEVLLHSTSTPKKLLSIEEINRIYCLTVCNSENKLEAYTINTETNSFIHLSSFSISGFPISTCESACYSSTANLAYFTGKVGIEKALIILDYTELNTGNPIAAQYFYNNLDQVVYDQSLDQIYCTGDLLIKISGTEIQDEISMKGTANHLILADNEIAISNGEGCSISLYGNDLTLLSNVILGDDLLRGCLNPNWNKIYWLSYPSQNPESFLTIHNLSNNSMTTVTIGSGIQDMSYNSNTDKLVVANWYDDSHLTVIDGFTNDMESIPSCPYNVVFAGNIHYTYLGGGNCLDYLDLTNNNIGQIASGLTSPYSAMDFAMLSDGNIIALVVENQVYGCKLLEIDQNSNQVIGTYHYQLEPANYNTLYYNKFKNQIYINTGYGLTIINAVDFTIIGTIYPSDFIDDFIFASRNNQIIIRNRFNYEKISFYDATSFTLVSEINLSPWETILSMDYNPNSDLLYLHVLNYYQAETYANEVRLYAYRCRDFTLSSDVYLEQNNINYEFAYYPNEHMVFDETYSFLYIPNQGLGNISIVQCSSDQIPLSGYYSWISFPRLERDPMQNIFINAEDVLNNRIKPGPDAQYFGWMQYLQYDENYPGNEHMVYIHKPSTLQHWNPDLGDLDFVSSTQGYVLHVAPQQQYIKLYGDVQDPSVEVELRADFENWVGYFLPYPQHPVNAIPSVARDNLTRMAGQYWYCVNENPYPDGSGGLWRCACSKGDVEVNYGDMIKLYSNADASFNWQQLIPSSPGTEKPPAELFSYEEQANYEAFFLELDTSDLPDEIGAMVNDTCIGATKVYSDEDTVLICAYTEGFEGEEISFQFAYSTKNSRPRIRAYSVLNNRTGIKEQRSIKVGENQPYYFISFKDASREASGPGSGWINCHPNPASREVIVDFFLDKEGEVTLQLVSTLGNVISSWSLGAKSPGNYQYTFPTSDIPGGYYLVSLSAGNQIHTKKLCIIH